MSGSWYGKRYFLGDYVPWSYASSVLCKQTLPVALLGILPYYQRVVEDYLTPLFFPP